jgi:hypothetical protein
MLSYFLRVLHPTMEFIGQHEDDIVITNADKGGKTVVMLKTQYTLKMQSLVSDQNTYKIINRDPTLRVQRDLNAVLKTTYDKNEINWYQYNKLTAHNTVCPKIYGLPKIHKDNVPLRPIVSFVQTPTYETAVNIAKTLRQLKDIDKYNIKNSFELKNEIQKEKIPEGFSLVSFDVVSLFTSIDLTLVKEEILNRWSEIDEHTPFNRVVFEKLLDFCLNAGYFSFDGTMYKQTFGTPMGSPLSPVLADIIMDKVLDHVMSTVGEHINYVCKYVDDILTIVRTSELQKVLDAFHEFNESLRFTYELAIERRIPYLETLLISNEDGSIDVDWYQKPTATNRILNFHSNHPKHQKLNTAEGLLHRAMTLCSDKFVQKNINIARNILKENSYNSKTINQLIGKIYKKRQLQQQRQQPQQLQQQQQQQQERPQYKSLTFVKELSEKIVNVVKNVDDNIKIALKANRNYRSIKSVTKDQVPLLDQSNVVYNIPCSECDLSYVGQTCQYLKNRIYQHRMGKRRTAVFIHQEEPPRHKLNYDDVEILQREPYTDKREFLEMLHINNNNTINIKTDIAGISNTYKPLLKMLHVRKLF